MPRYVDELNDEPTVEINGRRGVLRICPVCGSEYAAERHWLRQGQAKFCSHACYAASKRTTDLEAYFWDRIRKTRNCWLWTGALSHGYGLVINRGLNVHIRAHRYSYELHYGPIPDGLEVCHTCDRPSCVRPDHLFLGTQTDNMQDAASKARIRHGIQHHAAKLDAELIARIIDMRERGMSFRAIGVQLHLCRTTVSNAYHGRSWKHIPRP